MSAGQLTYLGDIVQTEIDGVVYELFEDGSGGYVYVQTIDRSPEAFAAHYEQVKKDLKL